MSRNHDETATTDTTLDAPVGRMRLLPTFSFGARAASLVRVALPVAVLTVGVVAGPAAAGPPDITCCPPNSQS
jgi:hypothetical protein